MSKLSQEQLARANKSFTRLLQAIEKTQQNNIAIALGCDESKVSRAKNNDLEWFCHLLAAAGLKIVPQDYKTLDREFFQCMLVMNKKLINRVDDIDDLAHDELSTRDDLDF